MRRSGLIALAAGLLCAALASPAFADQKDDAADAYDRRDYAAALRLLRPLADGGDAEVQFALGVMYANGEGVEQDFDEAARWFGAAAETGDPFAQFALGQIHLNSSAVSSDPLGAAIDAQAAYFWLSLASAIFDPIDEARQLNLVLNARAAAAANLSPRMIAETDAEVRAWRPER